MVNSMNKGKTFERTVVHLLNKLTNATWQRVPCSGATATSRNVNDHRFRGDVFSETERFKETVVECKITGETLTLASLLSEKSLIWKWWEQTVNESGNHSFMLIFRYRRSPIMMLSRHIPMDLGFNYVEQSIRIADQHGEICWLSILE